MEYHETKRTFRALGCHDEPTHTTRETIGKHGRLQEGSVQQRPLGCVGCITADGSSSAVIMQFKKTASTEDKSRIVSELKANGGSELPSLQRALNLLRRLMQGLGADGQEQPSPTKTISTPAVSPTMHPSFR